MAVVQEKITQPENNLSSIKSRILIWIGLAFLAAVVTLLFYTPGILNLENRASLGTSSLPGHFGLNSPEMEQSQFYQDWNSASNQLFHGKIPFWKDPTATDKQPLLGNSTAPSLYPLSLIYYLGPKSWKLLAFGMVHFWLLIWACLAIIRRAWFLRLRRKVIFTAGTGLLLAAFAIYAGTLRPDYLAALSWTTVGLVIILSGRKSWQLLWLTLVLGLVILATTSIAGIWLGVGLLVFALALETMSKPKLVHLLSVGGLLLVVFTGAISLAGPELWPKWAYTRNIEKVVAFHGSDVPFSFELGLYGAFLSLMSVSIGMGMLAWLRIYRPEDDERTVRRVAKNSVTPLFAQLTGKIVDVGFAIFTLRLLGPEGNGAYGIAVTTWVFLSTISEFGLETLTTRDVARDRSQANANHYLSTVFVTRSLLSISALPVSAVIIIGLGLSGNLTSASAWAIIVLVLGLIPGGLSGSFSAIFRAFEKFEYTAALQIFTAIVKVPIGLALLLIWGVVGLAASALIVNLITLVLLYSIFRSKLFIPHLERFDWKLARKMLHESYPLMLNGFLINVFFQSDVYLLLPFRGVTEVGWYNAAYKFINGLLIIPSTLTLALFPLFSSYGSDAKANLTRAYREALRILIAIALPISVGTLFVAYDVIGTVSGKDYLPHTAIALQILIWFLPFSYINGVTQYVLIALNRQRTITIAVIGSVITNVGLNLIFIPFFGYQAASVMTIVSEIALLIPFSIIIKRSLGSIPMLEVSLRPVIAAGIMALTLALLTLILHIQNFFLTALVGALVYPVALLLVRGFTKDDLTILKKALRR